MATKGNKGNLRVSPSSQQYVTEDGETLKYLTLTGNTPRLSGVRTGRDKEFLKSNDGKLSKLQHNIA